MAIKIKDLQTLADTYTEKGYLYKDLGLDLVQDGYVEPGSTRKIYNNDIKVSYDLAAIRNSLQNLFNTLPGQRFLFPEYGLDINQFLFTQMTELNAQNLGKKIENAITVYEPRVTVRKIVVNMYPDQNVYFLNIIIGIPTLGLTTQTDFLFDLKKQSFIYVPTSRNK